jgi:hypothetical protein
VETYFVSRRLRAPTGEELKFSESTDAFSRDYWGRYVDHFERREGRWRVLNRTVVTEAKSDSLALSGARIHPLVWGQRNMNDRLYEARKEIKNFSWRNSS